MIKLMKSYLTMFINQYLTNLDSIDTTKCHNLSPRIGSPRGQTNASPFNQTPFLGQCLCQYLTRNNLIGQIPFHFGHMSKLLILRLRQNSLTGVIPFTLGNLSSLQQLFVAFNHLQKGIPHDLRTLMGILTNSLSANALPNKL